MQKACVAVLMVALAGGCNNTRLFGRLIGFVVNGVTGQRLNAFPASNSLSNLGNDPNATNEVFALIEGKFTRAQPCGQGDANSKNLITADGCFKFEGVPANTDIPVFAQFDGFERFQGLTRIVTNAFSVTDIIDTDPQKVGNIMMWPLGFQMDYTFFVTSGPNRPVAGATVNCQANPATDTFQTTGNDFIPPEQTTLQVVTATTAADGSATIPGAQLVNGSSYHCDIFVSTPFEDRAVQGTTTFTAGVTQPQIFVSLTTSGAGPLIYAIRANNDNAQALLGASASLVVTLNRPVQIFPGSQDCETAALAQPNTSNNGQPIGVLPTDVVNNGTSEQVNASVSGDGLTLTVTNKPYTTPLNLADLGSSISFNGILIESADTTIGKDVFRIGAAAPNASQSCILAAANGAPAALFDVETNGNVSNTLSLF